ncbi:hypothetical protein M0813_07874 [Anaeramoeba flamelloides]|uniref:Uncharacterized protein n=1 Tax=Anaeramoeba flamelloides TaxID=1746091 RepID=A0ABQ8XAF3_9EUKA|nr:hypothetical protein M0813_07874 [Anaeramoeba flamelloides]
MEQIDDEIISCFPEKQNYTIENLKKNNEKRFRVIKPGLNSCTLTLDLKTKTKISQIIIYFSKPAAFQDWQYVFLTIKQFGKVSKAHRVGLYLVKTISPKGNELKETPKQLNKKFIPFDLLPIFYPPKTDRPWKPDLKEILSQLNNTQTTPQKKPIK